MPETRRENRAKVILCCLVVPVVYILDQLSKKLAVQQIGYGGSVPVIKGVAHITLVHNTGAAFGILRRQPHVFIAIAVLSIFLILYFLTRRRDSMNRLEVLSLSLMLGGTIGNLTDRLKFGHVIDFIDLRVWPVFNIADSCITVGAILLGFSLLIIRKRNAVISDK